MDKTLLRSKIFMRYNTRSAFADAMGWQKGHVTTLLNGEGNVSLTSAEKMAKILGLTPAEAVAIFMPSVLQNGNNEEVEHGKIDA